MADEKRDEKRRAGQAFAAAETTIQAIMSTYEGRWWMCEFLTHCNMYGDAYLDDGDIYAALKRDGRANAGRYVQGQIDVFAANDYQRLIREMRARNTRAVEKAANVAEETRKEETGEVEFYSPLEEMADDQKAWFEAERARLAAEKAKGK